MPGGLGLRTDQYLFFKIFILIINKKYDNLSAVKFGRRTGMKGIRKIGLLTALSVCVGLCFFGYFLIWDLAAVFAAQDPELAFMRWPILTGCFVMLTGAVAALILGIRAAARREEEIFSRSTVKRLSWMGKSLGVSTAAITGVLIYSWVQLGSQVGLVGVYLLIFVLLFFTASSVMFFIRDLFSRAVEFHEENQLTV